MSAAAHRVRLFAFYTETDRGARNRMLAVLDRIDVLAPNWFSVRPAEPAAVRGETVGAVLRAARAAGTEVWPVVNGQFRSHPRAFALRGAREAFCRRAAEIAREPGVHGITLDLEGFPADRRGDLTALVRRCAAVVHGSGAKLAVYAPRRIARSTTRWNAAYDWPALAAAADLIVGSTYTEAWETPGPMTTPRGLREALDWAWRTGGRDVAPIVGAFGLRWPQDGGEPVLVAQRDAEAMAARTGGLRRDATGGRFRLGRDEISYTDAEAAAAAFRAIERRGFAWAALFTVGRESPDLWRLLPASIGRPAVTPR